MHEDRIRPNVVTYNTLVDVHGKTGQWEKAVRVLDDMRQEVRPWGQEGGERSTAMARVAAFCVQASPPLAGVQAFRCAEQVTLPPWSLFADYPSTWGSVCVCGCRTWSRRCAHSTQPSLPATCAASHRRHSK